MQIWNEKGIKYFIIFQDTNSLAFEAVPILLGSTIHQKCHVNYLTVKRYEGEKASILCSCEENNRYYKIRAIDYSLLKSIMDEDIKNNNAVISDYPAVTNIICFELENYYYTLNTTKNKLPEYIFLNNEDKSFRLESVLQDYVILSNKNCQICSLYMPRWLCFNPVKDSSNINDFYTPNDGEKKCFIRNKKKLTKLGWNIGENSAIHIDPLISSTTDLIKEHFSEKIEIFNKSKLVIEGNVYISNLYLKGSLIIKVKNGGYLNIKTIVVNNAGIEYEKCQNKYYTKKICSKGEVILEYGNNTYNIDKIIL